MWIVQYSESGEHAKGVVSTELEGFPIPPVAPRPPAASLATADAAKELLRPLLVTMPMPESSRRPWRREWRVEAAEDEEPGEVQPS